MQSSELPNVRPSEPQEPGQGGGRPHASTASEARLSLLEKRRHSLPVVAAGHQRRLKLLFDRQRRREAPGIVGECLFESAEGQRSNLRQLVRDVDGLRHQLIGGDDCVDQAGLLGLVGAKGGAHGEERACLREPHPVRDRPQCAHVWQNAGAQKGGGQSSRVRRDNMVASGKQRDAAASGNAVDSADHGFGPEDDLSNDPVDQAKSLQRFIWL